MGINWEKISCICGEKRKRGSPKNKVHYQPTMSSKIKGKMVFYCTSNKNPDVHSEPIHFIVDVYEVNDQIIDVRKIVLKDKYPEIEVKRSKRNSRNKR